MNWFERYGIPGSYFVVLTIAWIHTLFPCMRPEMDPKSLLTVLGGSFLPVGYILHILQQWLYLLIKPLGTLRRAKREAVNQTSDHPDDELTIEAYTLLLIWKKRMPPEWLQYITDWNRRRMDVMAIDGSIVVATILSFLVAWLLPWCCFGWRHQCDGPMICFLTLISVIILVVTTISWRVMQKQIMTVMAKVYEKYR